ncbi:MAG: iron-containing alcohol dehydrogenase [Muribaculaceae bacterium]
MINFEYYNPAKIIFGKGVISNVGEEITKQGAKNILLVYGGGSIKKNGVYDNVTKSLKDSNIYYTELSGVKPNPVLSKVMEGKEICKTKNIDFILAVGGGSVIDTAKAIGVATLNDGDVWDFYMGIRSTIPYCLPIGVVLTIPAAGSETSYASIITNENGNYKRGIHDNIIIPKFAVIDPETSYSLSMYQMACGASDILAHLMERYFTLVPNVELTDRMIEAACTTIINNTLKAIRNPLDYDTRAEIMLTGTFAHNNSLDCGRIGDWGSHNIEHELSATYDIAHGAGLSIIFPAWIRYVWHTSPSKFIQFAKKVFGIDAYPDDQELIIAQLLERFENWYKQIGMPTRLSHVNIDNSKFKEMAHRALDGRSDGFGQFYRLHEEDIIAIYKLAQ